MIILGVDFGTKRIGLASGDTSVTMAFPLRSIANEGPDAAVAATLAAAKQEGAERIVVGMPHRMTGEGEAQGAEPGETETRVRAFIAALGKKTALPVETEDERLTSAYVDSLRKSVGGKQKDFDRDSAAAAAILETFMQRMR